MLSLTRAPRVQAVPQPLWQEYWLGALAPPMQSREALVCLCGTHFQVIAVPLSFFPLPADDCCLRDRV